MVKKLLLVSCILLMLFVPTCSAVELPADSAFISAAVYIDTSGHYIPGIDIINKGLNQLIRMQINSIFLGSEVYCGSEVLRDLRKHDITNSETADPDKLTAYCEDRMVNYVMLFTINPLDITVNLKAFSAKNGSYVVEQKLSPPPELDVSLTTFDKLSNMLTNQLPQIFASMRG